MVDHNDADLDRWQALKDQLEALQPSAEALEDRKQLLFSNAIYRLGEFIDLWQDCRSLQDAILCDARTVARGLSPLAPGRLTPFIDRGLMLYSVASTILAIIVASCCGFCSAGRMAAVR